MATETQTGTCKSCFAPIVWVRTPGGRAMPLDRDPVAGGNLVIEDGVCRHVPTPAPDGVVTYKSHFATCPGASIHRRTD